jgi:hypothetical protein
MPCNDCTVHSLHTYHCSGDVTHVVTQLKVTTALLKRASSLRQGAGSPGGVTWLVKPAVYRLHYGVVVTSHTTFLSDALPCCLALDWTACMPSSWSTRPGAFEVGLLLFVCNACFDAAPMRLRKVGDVIGLGSSARLPGDATVRYVPRAVSRSGNKSRRLGASTYPSL